MRRPAAGVGHECGRDPLVSTPGPSSGGWLDATDVLTVYAAVLFLVPAPLILGPLGAAGSPASLLGVALLLWWLVARTVPGLHPAGLQPVHIAILFLAAAVIVSYGVSMMDPRLPVEVRGADRGLIRLASWAGVLLFAADGIVNRARLNALVRRIVVLAAIVAATGMVQFWLGVDLAGKISIPGLIPNGDLVSIERSIFNRVRATATHPIEFGVVLAIVLPLALYLTVGRSDRRARNWVALALVGVAGLLSISRSAVVGIGVAAVVVFFGWDWPTKRKALLLAPFLVVGLRLAVPGLVGTLRSMFTHLDSDPSVSGRTDDYAVVGHYLQQDLLTGRGFGTFIPSIYTTFDNQYLLQLVETGVLGLAALMTFFVIGWCVARGARRRSRGHADRQLGQALAAAIASAAVTAALFDSTSFPMSTGLTFLVIGCAGAAWRLAREEQLALQTLAPTARRESEQTTLLV